MESLYETYVAITGSNVNVREQGDPKAPVIEVLSYDLVERVDCPPRLICVGADGWERIRTPAGKCGYVWSDYARALLEYRFAFRKEGTDWKITGALVGD
jgi:hypothetical protein